MNRDRLVQVVASTLAVAALVGTLLLSPVIRQQREELQLTFTLEGDRSAPATYVLLNAAGSLRGLLADVLWYRIEHLKRAGKVHEANTLAQWITKLQPRFAQVWAFHAWNMAYNISVMTHTPEERWMWVQKGIRLLRSEGIPNNPTVIRLYRELGWIFFHKVGQYTDDMHWYYKIRLADKWQKVLGAQAEGATTEQVLADFKPIADADDSYFELDDGPSQQTIDQLNTLIDENADFADTLRRLRDQDLEDFKDRVPRVQQQLREQQQFALAKQLDPLLASAERRWQRSKRDPLRLLREDVPATAETIDAWRELGLSLSETGLSDYGRMKMLARYATIERLLNETPDFLSEHDLNVLRFMRDHEGSEGLKHLLAFLRARVLIQNYNMRPTYMYTLMDMYGPLDWRHPSSHAIYWSALGVRMSGEIRDRTKFDILNTDRQVIHSLQNLMFMGRVNYDPIAGTIDMVPDPRFIPAYDKAMESAIARATDPNVDFPGGGNRDSFEAGHENFLHKAILYSYLYGSEEQAQKYYEKVRRLYGDKAHNQRTGRYQQPLDAFVLQTFQRDKSMYQVSRPFIESMIHRGLSQGLANGRVQVFNRFLRLARQMHQAYNEQHSSPNPNAPRQRMSLPPFDELLVETYVSFMRSPGIDIYNRARVYGSTPSELRQRAFPEFRPAVYRQAQQRGIDPQRAFPEPAAADEAQPLRPQQPDAEGSDTVRRK